MHHSQKYTPEMIAYLKEHYPHKSSAEMAVLFNCTFGTSIKPYTVRATCKRYGIKSGRTGKFDECRKTIKTNAKDNTKPVGTHVVWNDGTVRVKTGENEWRLLKELVWEDANGKLPPGHYVMFYDNSWHCRTNPTLDNMFIVNDSIQMRLNMSCFAHQPRNIQETMLLHARLAHAIAKRQKEMDT